jgi:thioesterase domain-containing protein/acyl carrier protein
MVPARFMLLEQLPLTPNGKVDRKALPAPDATRSAAGYVAPRTTLETTLAAIWADLLGLDKVGVQDNFFSLGGHSLLSIELFQEIKSRINISLPVATIFTAPTIAALAEMVDAGQHARSLLVPLQQHGSDRPLFCIHPVGGHISFYREIAEQLGEEFPLYGIQSPEVAGVALKFSTIEEMACAYCKTIVDAQPDGPYRLIGWSTGGVIAMAIAKELERQGHEVDTVCLLDSRPILASVKASPSQLSLIAAVTTLASIRSNTFTPSELHDMQTVLADSDISIDDFFHDARRMFALPYLEQWTGIAITAEVWQHLKSQIKTTERHLALLAGFLPEKINGALHVFWANAAHPPASADFPAFVDFAMDWRMHEPTVNTIDGNHYTMLKKPYVQQLGKIITSILQEAISEEM